MKALKALGRILLISIITAIILFNMFVALANYGQFMFSEGRKYQMRQTTEAGGFLPTGDEKVLYLAAFMDSRHTG